METVRIKASNEYNVYIGTGFLDKIGEMLSQIKKSCRVLLISDDNVFPIYGERVKNSLCGSGYEVSEFVFRHGEESKSLDTFGQILEYASEQQLTRGDLFIALGGGVTGDLTGFAAASYLRGIDFVQIPTTLLAMVDSSVGGKTAVNLRCGKNLCGAFYQPAAVYSDCTALDTLPPVHFAEGCAEIIKYGMIMDSEFLSFLREYNIKDNIEYVVKRCVELKRDIVVLDEFENGQRKILNFGHTVGHAIEIISDFKISHGEAVAIGMMIAAKGAYRTGLSEYDCSSLIKELLEKNNLPSCCGFDAESLCRIALSDKKRNSDTISLIIPESYGHCRTSPVPVSDLLNFIQQGLK